MTLLVIAVDLQTGQHDGRLVEAGDYVLVCAEPCRLATTEELRGGTTHVLTVVERRVDAGREAAGMPARGGRR